MSITMHEELYRSDKAMKHIRDFRVMVAGAGALGGNIVESLARQGFTKVEVVDCDHVEEHNLSTQPYSIGFIGRHKTIALSNKIYKDLGIHLGFTTTYLDLHNVDKLITGRGLIVDAFDNAPSRALLALRTEKLRIPCFHVGISEDGNYAEGVWNRDYQLPESLNESDICDYPLARNLVSVTVGLACEKIVRFVVDGEKGNFSFTFKDLKINQYG